MDPYAALKEWQQFLLWRLEERNGASTKVPVSPFTGLICNAMDPNNWATYDVAMAMRAYYPGTGIAFVLTANDPFFGSDLDKCRDKETGNCTEMAATIINMFPGALVEVSQSGTGYHIIGKLAGPVEHGCRNSLLHAELYTSDRFLALGDMSTAVGDSGTVFDLSQFVQDYFAPSASSDPSNWTDRPMEGYTSTFSDEQLLSKMLDRKQDASVFGNGPPSKASFADLWTGNMEVLPRLFPADKQNDPWNRSRVDATLIQHLAWWTGGDCARIERIMRSNPIHAREKWDGHPTYLKGTITGAVGNLTDFYSKKPKREGSLPPNIGHSTEIRSRGSNVTIMLDELPEFFRHYVYLIRDDKILDTRNGASYNQRQFAGMMGGWEFQVGQGEKARIEKDAFMAFTRNSLYEFPRVYGEMFRPDLQPWCTFEEDGHVWINNFQDIRMPAIAGDITMFLDHVNAMLPRGDDALILLCYLAALLQYPGRKFTWCPVIVGAEGNGKSWLVDLMMAIIGHRYCYKPSTKDITSQFNAYEEGKLFLPIEEMKATNDILDTMKVSITNERVRIEAKGRDGHMAYNFANYVINTNHIDGVPVDENSRRFCMLVCEQQTAKEVLRDFGDKHFSRLFHWRDYEGGASIVAHYLENMEIDERYNPAGDCNRAPVTTGTARVIRESLCIVGKHVQNAIEDGRQGFRGDWVSSTAITRLLKELRLDTNNPPNSYRAIMSRLDYEWCPSLISTNGRVNNYIKSEGSKPVLYCRRGSIQHLNLMSPAQVRSAYINAQEYEEVHTHEQQQQSFV